MTQQKLFGVKLAAIFRGQANEVTSGSDSRSITFMMQYRQISVLLTCDVTITTIKHIYFEFHLVSCYLYAPGPNQQKDNFPFTFCREGPLVNLLVFSLFLRVPCGLHMLRSITLAMYQNMTIRLSYSNSRSFPTKESEKYNPVNMKTSFSRS